MSSRALIALLVVALGPARVLAGPPQDRVRQTIDAVSAVLKDPQLQGGAAERDRRERVGHVMQDAFDFRTMAR